MLLFFMATLEILVKGTTSTGIEQQESFAEAGVLCLTMIIIVNIAVFLDWKRERMFEALTKRLAASNLRFIIRDGNQMQVTDQDMCVGDIVSFNAHMAATISVDGILLGGQDGKCDESALTGDPEPISKSAETLFMISGATVNAGNGTTLVIAVGDHSIAGKIKKSVYGEEGGKLTPLYHKLDKMANQTGKAGLVGASIAMIARLVLGVWCSQET